MKKFLLFFFALILFGCRNHHNTSITITDEGDQYTFEAQYPEGKTAAVQEYLNDALSPNRPFSSTAGKMDITTPLPDGTHIRIKCSAGNLKMELEEKKQSRAGREKIRAIGQRIKKILTEN